MIILEIHEDIQSNIFKLDTGLSIGNWYHTVLWYTGQKNCFALIYILIVYIVVLTLKLGPLQSF